MKLGEEVRAFLDVPRFAVVGTVNPDRSPHLSAIWYDRRGDEVIVNTTQQRIKARNLAEDPRVSLLVGGSERYVRLDGVARAVAFGDEALKDIRALGVRYDGEAAADRQVRAVWGKQDRVTYAVQIHHVYKYGFG
ncbi:MAG: PPOX class F420-dependent oxidoreductase [Chloroflexota bacterium]|nr:PPOX class F420-dependent oxidoreductase [Chloroflexota bacterium]